MIIDTPTPDNQTEMAPGDPGSEEAAAAAFAGKEPADEADEHDEAEPDDAAESDADAEPDEGDPDDAEGKDKRVEVEYEGKTYEVAPELQKALLRQADYSRKMNEVGSKEKALTQQMEQADKLVSGAEKFAEALAEVQTIDTQLKQFEKLEWQKLRQENPAEYAALAADLQSLRLSRDEATRKASHLDGELAQAKHRLLAEKQGEMHKELGKKLKGWGDELGTKITKYAVENGYSVEDIRQISDPKWVIAMDKARRYDALQASKTTVKAKAQDAPAVVKPGAPRKADPKGDAMARLRKTNSMDDAAAAFYR